MPVLLPFILSCFKAGSPFKTIAITIIATILFSAVGLVAYKVYSSEAKVVKLTQQVIKVTQAAHDLSTTVKDTAASIAVNAAAETTQTTVAKKITLAHTARINVTKQRERLIINDTKLPPQLKEKDLSKIYITSIWAEYCASSSVDQSECSTNATQAPTPSPEAPINDLNNQTDKVSS